MDDARFTALDQYFCDHFADRFALSDRIEMVLALRAGVDGKIGVVKRGRVAKNWSRDRNGIIYGKGANQRRGCIRVRRDLVRELDPGFQLDHGDEDLKYLVEQFGLFPRIAAGAGDEQIGDARESS